MEDLIFIRKDGAYEATFVSTGGKAVVQMQRDENSLTSVSAAMEGMQFVSLGTIDNPTTHDELFAVEVPAGMTVTIVSQTEVKSAKVML